MHPKIPRKGARAEHTDVPGRGKKGKRAPAQLAKGEAPSQGWGGVAERLPEYEAKRDFSGHATRNFSALPPRPAHGYLARRASLREGERQLDSGNVQLPNIVGAFPAIDGSLGLAPNLVCFLQATRHGRAALILREVRSGGDKIRSNQRHLGRDKIAPPWPKPKIVAPVKKSLPAAADSRCHEPFASTR